MIAMDGTQGVVVKPIGMEVKRMSEVNEIVLEKHQLPLRIVLKGDSGEVITYGLMPAGRKFGASLQKIDKGMVNLAQ